MNRILKTPNPISVTRSYAIQDKNPIITRASGQPVGIAQSLGLPGSKTILGAYRMGESELSTGAIYPGEIFPPMPPSERPYSEVLFSNVGNNTFQPEDNDEALHSLLRRLGEQKFKAKDNLPFENYFATQRLAKEVEDAAKISGLEDKTLAREIVRGLVDLRRKQNDDDYLRRLIDAGMSAEQAQREIDEVVRARALHEAKNVDDRPYQAKMLIHNLSKSRGVISGVNEPLTMSGAISSPAPNHTMASLMGKPETAFGESPMDMNRINMTPEFYKRFLRRSALTSDVADSQTAMNQLLAEGIDTTGFNYPAMVTAGAREKQIMDERDNALARLDTIRNRGRKAFAILPEANLFSKEIIDKIYKNGLGDKKPGEFVAYKKETISDMNVNQLIIALNTELYKLGNSGLNKAKSFLQRKELGSKEKPNPKIEDILKELVRNIADSPSTLIPVGINNGGDIPVFRSKDEPFSKQKLIFSALDEIRSIGSAESVFNTAISNRFSESYADMFAPLLSEPEKLREQMLLARAEQERSIFGSSELNPPSNLPEGLRAVATRRLKPEGLRAVATRPQSEIKATSVPMLLMGAKPSGRRDEEFIAATKEMFPRGSKPKLVIKPESNRSNAAGGGPAPRTPTRAELERMSGKQLEEMLVARGLAKSGTKEKKISKLLGE